MKIELCSFSGYKIYPGHGRAMVKIDGKSYKFLSPRTQKVHDLKRNPRKITWIVLYRGKPKKGQEGDGVKKPPRGTQKFQGGVVGASIKDILAKRNQKPEVGKAQGDQAIRAAKGGKKNIIIKPAAGAPKKAPAKDTKAQKAQMKATKKVAKSAPGVGGKG
uniref:Large ribosomal subunit protein eL24 n=1 Tax=Pseudodiaptomus poplesia TaxID=213370 RepID=A0A0U2IGG1_9MAXI|nr:60S ribosomal protein L24 [Pseudodiaptomus poplesia]